MLIILILLQRKLENIHINTLGHIKTKLIIHIKTYKFFKFMFYI